MLGVTLSELLSGLEAGEKLVVEPSRGSKDGGFGMKMQNLVRQMRVQQTAADRAITSLEQLVSSPTKMRRPKPGPGKSK